MDINREAPTPLYVQLKDLIGSAIGREELKPGDRVGSETELGRAYGISRITVRHAIAALVQDGALYRVPGKGTYVASPRIAPLAAFTSFSENMAAQGQKPSYHVFSSGWVNPCSQVREALHLAPKERVFRLDRLLLANRLPIGVQLGYYPERHLGTAAAILTPETLGSMSLYRLMEERLGLTLWKADETVEPAIASREEVRRLGISRDTPVLVVNRIAYLASGEPVEAVRLIFRGDTYRYRVQLYRAQRSGEL